MPSPDARPDRQPTFPCPHCGAEVPAGRQSCPACGSDEETGWAAEGDVVSQLPTGYGRDEEFDYDEHVAREFGRHRPRPASARLKYAAIATVTIILIILFVLLMSGR